MSKSLEKGTPPPSSKFSLRHPNKVVWGRFGGQKKQVFGSLGNLRDHPVAKNNQSKIVFEGTKKQHQKWLEETKFRRGTVHHVYEDRGDKNVSYFRATKK